MRIFYYLSAYISHRLAGLEYIACLRALGHEVVCNYPDLPDRGGGGLETGAERSGLDFVFEAELADRARRADLFIVHEDPYFYEELLSLLPDLRQNPPVFYLPWENEELPQAWRPPLSMASGIWTCSEFSRQALSRVCGHTEVLPHVVRRPKAMPADLDWGRNLLKRHGAEGATLFLSVMDGANPRKNLSGLLAAFKLLCRESRHPVRLLLKQYRVSLPLEDYPEVVNIMEMLNAGRMAALHILSDAYVSPHHAEGWGLSLSSAMALGKTVIATGYSGNLEFMSHENSLLLPYKMVQVSREMTERIPLFQPEMRWADPDLSALLQAMRQVAEGRVPPELNRKAAGITERFGPERICLRLKELLERAVASRA
ncbi:MAG: glycosyltransferase [Desulfovibrionaceae bacterium]|nr:glycosyltransferase [Desulfovibrionaceae bacterium]